MKTYKYEASIGGGWTEEVLSHNLELLNSSFQNVVFALESRVRQENRIKFYTDECGDFLQVIRFVASL